MLLFTNDKFLTDQQYLHFWFEISTHDLKQLCCSLVPLDGGYSDWGVWTTCTKSCGSGTQSRSRTCSNPAPQKGGKDCSHLGNAVETKTCNVRECPTGSSHEFDTSLRLCVWICCNFSLILQKQFTFTGLGREPPPFTSCSKYLCLKVTPEEYLVSALIFYAIHLSFLEKKTVSCKVCFLLLHYASM